MQFSINPRRLAALFPLALACLAGPAVGVAAQTQIANVVPIIALTTPGEDYEEAPRTVRSDMLLASDGNVYFGAFAGGKGAGAVARLTPAGVLSTLYSLAGNGSEGLSIIGPLMQASDGALYGTAYLGGEEGLGTLFRLTLDGTFSILHHFGGGQPNAILPYTGVTEGPDGQLYGTTLRGGTPDAGVVYRIGVDGSGYTVLHEFGGSSGIHPEGTLVLAADGMLYGTTALGGENNRGTIYRISTAGAVEVLYHFPALGRFSENGQPVNATGANPRAGMMIGADGNFYGTAHKGGEFGFGTVFRLTPAGELTVVHAFSGPSFGGATPLSSLTQDAEGNIYGTTEAGGTLHRGTAWRLAPDGTHSILHSFNGSSDGVMPYASVLPAHGTLYAISQYDTISSNGQPSGYGAIMKLDVGVGGMLPLTLTTSATEVMRGESITVTWNGPAGYTCTRIGGSFWTGDVAVAGTEQILLNPGVYALGMRCVEPDDGDAATPQLVRVAHTAVEVNAPLLSPVDGGGGAGSLSLSWLLLAASLLFRKVLKENA